MEILGILSLIFGIAGLISSYWYIGMLLCLIGLVMGIVGAADCFTENKFPVAGILISVLGIVMSVYFIVSDLDSGRLLVYADKFVKHEKVEEDDDFMRFRREGWEPEQEETETVVEELDEAEAQEVAEKGTSPYWMGDGNKTESKESSDPEDNQQDLAAMQTEENNHEEGQEDQGSKSSGNKEYRIGDTWTVDGQWKLTITGVSETQERNSGSEKSPASVYVIDYKYENTGYEKEYDDGIYFSIENQTITDSTGKVGYGYDVDSTLQFAPKSAPVGAYCEAKDSIGVDNSGEFKIYFTKYDGNDERQEAVFVVTP